MFDHEYRGILFKIAESVPAARRDELCAALLDYKARNSEKPAKVKSHRPKVIPSPGEQSPLGGRTSASPSMLPDTDTILKTVDDLEKESRYLLGNYREPCRTCGKPIKRTGKRGRAPINHAKGECGKSA